MDKFAQRRAWPGSKQGAQAASPLMPQSPRLLCRAWVPVLGLATLLIAQGCTVGPAYVRPAVAVPASFKEPAAAVGPDGTLWAPAQPQDAAQRGAWWKIYQEPELDALEDRLNASNQTVEQAYQNYMAAQAQVRQARAGYAPTLSLQPGFTRSGQALSAASSGLSGSAANALGSGARTNLNDYSAALAVSWEPDLWGKVRNTVRQAANGAQISAADLANTRLSAQASLAQDYFELRGQDSLIALNQQTVAAYRKSLALTEVLGDTGIDSEQAVAQARVNLKTAEAAGTNLGIARAQYEHAIALLVGEPASTFALPMHALTSGVPEIPPGVPSALLQRRPDIAAAERAMSQANAQIGVETAAFYPSVSISLTGGFQNSLLQNWFTWPSRFFSLGPSATQTLFDAGLRTAAVAQYQAQYDSAVAAYRQSVLTAFQQTEDYLAASRILAQQLDQQQEVVAAARHNYDIAMARYRTGVDTYLNVFVAQTALFSDQQSSVTLRVQQMTNSVQLIEALGGGWDATQLPSEKDVAAAPR